MGALILLLVFAAGFAVQRGTTCAVAAVGELIEERRPQRFLAFLAGGAASLVVVATACAFGRDVFIEHRGTASPALAIAGGAVFGLGAWLNGRCALGTIARLGAGEAPRIGTLIGFLAGFGAAAQLGIESPAMVATSPFAGLAPLVPVSVGLGALALLAIAARAPQSPEARDRWHPLVALILIGVVNGVLLTLAVNWPYTNLLMDLASSTGMAIAWRSLMALVLVAGAVASAMLAAEFRPVAGRPALWVRSLAGGAMMGAGSVLVPGGNDTMLLVGLPLLLTSFALAYLAMSAVVALCVAVTHRRPGPPPAEAG